MNEEQYIDKFNSIRGMVYQMLRDNPETRNSEQWLIHCIRKECAEEYFSKSLGDLSKEEVLVLPKASTIVRHSRAIRNDQGKFQADEDVQIEREIKEKAMHKNYSEEVEKV